MRAARSERTTGVAERTSEPVLTPMGISSHDTKLDAGNRQALTARIKTAVGRLHMNLGHPKCLAVGGGTRKAQRAVKCLRCSTCEKVSRSRSHRPCRIPTDEERFNERLFVDLCDVVDTRENRCGWLETVDHHTDFTMFAPCPSHGSHAVAKKIFKHPICWAFQASLCAMASAVGASEVFTKNFQCQALKCKRLLLILCGKRVELSRALPPSRKLRARRPYNTK